jgi:ABC-type bacteriocin/lantibiotic exporter with double-glycine peptidase domain
MTGLLLTAILRALILGLRRHYLLRLEIKLGLTTATRFFWHVLHLPISFFAKRHASDVAGRITANEEVAKLLSGDFAVSLTTLGFFAAAMAAYDFALAGIAVGLGLLNFIALSLAGRSREDAARLSPRIAPS